MSYNVYITHMKHEGSGIVITKLYRVWTCMKYRCHGRGEKNPYAKWYRDKGIEVCEAWRNSFKEFEKWALSNGYKEGLTIDRVDSNGNYCPENCRWVTRSENSKNKRAIVKKSAHDIRATARKGSDTMTEHEYEVLSQIATFLEQQDKATREKLIIFCEGFVSATKLTEKGEKTA